MEIKNKWKDDGIRKRIGDRLRELRTMRGLTFEQLAEVTGLKPNSIARIEDGRFSVNLDILQVIANALGCRVDIVQE